jgi:hypothetical protein
MLEMTWSLVEFIKIIRNDIIHVQNSERCDTFLQIDWQFYIWTFQLTRGNILG